MPTFACLLPFLVFLLLIVQPLRAQTPDPPEARAYAVIPQAHAAGPPILHPALLALQEWNTLRLTPEQVNQLREVQEQTLSLLTSMLREQIQDTVLVSAWLFEQEVDEARVRAAVLRKAEQEAELLVQLLRAGRTVTEILSPEQVWLLRELQSAAVAQRVQVMTAEPPARPCTSGGAGGGVRMSPRAEAVYSVSFHGDSMHIGAVFVGRAARRLYGAARLPPKPELPGALRGLSGGSMETWYMQYDKENHVAWVHNQKVPLGADNAVLVDRVDRLHERLEVVRTLRVPSPVFTGGCPEGVNWSDLLRAHLEQVPEIRAFIRP